MMLWFATRATGEVALVLLTGVVVLGLATTKGWASRRWPESLITLMHRNISLLAVVFLGAHVATTVVDAYVPVGWADVVVPFRTPYKTLWLGIGATAFDLVLALIITSVVRRHLPVRAWKSLHWTAYACWAFAVAHGLGAGTDHTLTRLNAAAMSLLVLLALLARMVLPDRQDEPVVSVPVRAAERPTAGVVR